MILSLIHIYPSWQRKILGVLKKTFPNIQFIVTTHSPIVLSEADENYNVFFMKLEADEIEVRRVRQMNGYDANAVLEQFMETHSVNLETEKFIESIYEAIERGEYSVAEQKIAKLEEITNENHQDVIMARMELKRRMK